MKRLASSFGELKRHKLLQPLQTLLQSPCAYPLPKYTNLSSSNCHSQKQLLLGMLEPSSWPPALLCLLLLRFEYHKGFVAVNSQPPSSVQTPSDQVLFCYPCVFFILLCQLSICFNDYLRDSETMPLLPQFQNPLQNRFCFFTTFINKKCLEKISRAQNWHEYMFINFSLKSIFITNFITPL